MLYLTIYTQKVCRHTPGQSLKIQTHWVMSSTTSEIQIGWCSCVTDVTIVLLTF